MNIHTCNTWLIILYQSFQCRHRVTRYDAWWQLVYRFSICILLCLHPAPGCVTLLRTIITTAQYNLALLTSHCQVTKFILSLCIKTTIAQNIGIKVIHDSFVILTVLIKVTVWLSGYIRSPNKRNILKGGFSSLVPGVGKHPWYPVSQMNFLVTHQSGHLC